MASSSKSSSQPVVDPQSSDILCGKGKECHDFEGSQHYRKVIDSFRHKYASAYSRGQKMAVTTEIYDYLKAMNCRFLRYNPALEAWEELSLHAARDKIGHALRFANRTTRRDSETEDMSPPDLSEAICAGSIEQTGETAPPTGVLSRSGPDKVSAASTTNKRRKQAKKSSPTKSQLIRERVDATLRKKRWEALFALKQQQETVAVLKANGAQHNPEVAAFGNCATSPTQAQYDEIPGIESFWDLPNPLAQDQAGTSTSTHNATNIGSLHPASQTMQPQQWSQTMQPQQWGRFPNQMQRAADSSGLPTSPADTKQDSTMPSFCVRESLSLAQAGHHLHASNCTAGYLQLQQQYDGRNQELPLDNSLEPTPLPLGLPHALEPTPLPQKMPHAAMPRQDNLHSNVDWEDIKDELKKTFHGSAMATPFASAWDSHQIPSVSTIGPPSDDLQGASANGPGLEEQVHLFSDSLRDLESMRCLQNPSSTSQPGPVNAQTGQELLMVRNSLGGGGYHDETTAASAAGGSLYFPFQDHTRK